MKPGLVGEYLKRSQMATRGISHVQGSAVFRASLAVFQRRLQSDGRTRTACTKYEHAHGGLQRDVPW